MSPSVRTPSAASRTQAERSPSDTPRTAIMSQAARRFWLVVVSLFAFSSVFALALPATVLAWDDSSYNSASESQLVSLTNQARANAGL